MDRQAHARLSVAPQAPFRVAPPARPVVAVAAPARNETPLPPHPPVGDLVGIPVHHHGAPPPILRKPGGRCGCADVKDPSGGCKSCRQRREAGLAPAVFAPVTSAPAVSVSAAPPASDRLVSQPGDAAEAEADRIAAQLVRPPEPGLRPSRVGGLPATAPVMRAATATATAALVPRVAPELSALINRSGPGQPLDGGTRAAIEPRLGSSLAAVRVHSGPAAAASADALGARAFTIGHDIVFGASAYAPHTSSGRLLLAHELVHVAQARSAGAQSAVLRQACGHDGQETRCGGGGLARWTLVDLATDAVMSAAIDDLVVKRGLAQEFTTGTWVSQVTTPPNPVKFGADRGRVDGMKVELGSTLKLEVVEVKARSTQFAGGCALATREAQGYVAVLNRIASRVVALSQAFGGGGLAKELKAADRVRLRAAGIDLNDPLTRQALTFYLSLQNKLGQKLPAFTAMTTTVNADGTPNKTYDVMSVIADCTKSECKGGTGGSKRRTLGFQVNTAGGVTYGCQDTKCDCDEEERKKERKAVQKPQQVPVTDTQKTGQPRAIDPAQKDRPGDPTQTPAQDPKQTPAHDPTLPVVVGVGGAGTLTAAAVAYARHRAAQIAKREAAELAARQAAQAAWRKRLAEKAAGKTAAKAAVYLEVAAAAAVVIFYSDRAEAKAGPGESPIQTLYKVMTANGDPPSPELKQAIESDPVLKALAERAAESGDAGPLNEEAMRRVIEILRQHPDEFSPDDLEMLAMASRAGGAGGSIKSAEELQRAIEKARQGAKSGSKPGAPGQTGGAGTQPATGTPATQPGAQARGAPPHKDEPVPPGLSDKGRAVLPQLGTPRRQLLDAMIGRSGSALAVTDDSVKRFLGTVPEDLTAGESTALIGQLQAIDGESLDEVMRRVGASVKAMREKRKAGAGGTAKLDTESSKAPPPASTGTVQKPATQPKPGAQQKPGTKPPAHTGGTSAAKSDAAKAADEHYREGALKLIRAFSGWASLETGKLRVLGYEPDWHLAKKDAVIKVWAAVRLAGQPERHGAIFVTVRITDNNGTLANVVVESTLPLVLDDGSEVDFVSVGEPRSLSDVK